MRSACIIAGLPAVSWSGARPGRSAPDARLHGHDSPAELAGTFRSSHKAHRIAALRQTLTKLETAAAAPGAKSLCLSLGIPEVHRHLPGPGLACGVLNEVAAGSHGSRPAAFSFVFALAALALRARPASKLGPAVLVASRRALAEFGRPYGHGLTQLGLDVGRLLLIETKTDKDALWALEETLRSQARPALVVGALAGDLDLTMSRRLNLAAAPHSTPLVLLRAPRAAGTSAAAARWRIDAAPAGRDRFGAFAHWRWTVALDRCRNGRPGQWLIEWDHVAHRFRLAEGVADRAPAASAGLRLAG